MLWMLLFLLFTVALAGTVVLYVAYPHRGEQMPHLPWVGDAMRRGVQALPILHEDAAGRPGPSRETIHH